MANPIVTVPAAPLAIDATINTAAESFLSSLLQVFEHGTTGLVAPADETDATYQPQDDHGHVGPLRLRSREQQLFFRQLGIAIAVRFPAGGGGAGPPGPQGPPGLNWLGVFNPATTYQVDDAVEYLGSSFVSTSIHAGTVPFVTDPNVPNAGWELLALKGDQGPAWVPPPPAFSVGLSGGQTVETSQTIIHPAFTASYNRTPTSAALSDSNGNPSLNVIATPNGFSSPYTFVKNVPDQSVIFTLNAADATGAASSQASIVWRQRAYWGVGLQGTHTEALIKSLAGQQLTTTKNRSFTVDAANPTDSIFYAYRAVYGTSFFWVGGFEGGFNGPYTVSVTNAYGFTENYYLYESAQPNLGLTTVTVN